MGGGGGHGILGAGIGVFTIHRKKTGKIMVARYSGGHGIMGPVFFYSNCNFQIILFSCILVAF